MALGVCSSGSGRNTEIRGTQNIGLGALGTQRSRWAVLQRSQQGQRRLGLRQGKTDRRHLEPSSSQARLQLHSPLEAGSGIEPLLLAHQCRTQQVMVAARSVSSEAANASCGIASENASLTNATLPRQWATAARCESGTSPGRALSSTSNSAKAWLRSSSASRSIVAAHWWFIPAIMNTAMA